MLIVDGSAKGLLQLSDLMEMGHGHVLLINTGLSQPWLLFLNVFTNILYKHCDNLP